MIGLFVAAPSLLFVAWLVIEMRAEQPLVDVRMMRIPAVWWTNISAMLFGFGMYSVMIVVPAFLQTPSSAGYGFGASITKSGLALLPLSAAMLVAGILTGAFSTRFGSKVPLVVGSVFSALGMLFLAVAHGSEWNFYVAMALVGFGIGFAFSAMSNLVVEAVRRTQTGVATGMNANVRTIGGAIGSQIVASIIAAGWWPPRCRRSPATSSRSSSSASRSRSRASRRCSSRRAPTARPRPRGTSSTPWPSTRRDVACRGGSRDRGARPLSGQRVDAVRNRRRVLEAAFDEHARHGAALGMQDVARRAGVGIGTVYRHFPSRDALIEAIAHPFFERGLRSRSRCARRSPRRIASPRSRAASRGCSPITGCEGHCTWDAPAAEPVRAELRTLITEFVESGKRKRTLRRDLTAEDAFALLWTIAALVEAAERTGIWQRHLELVLDSLRGKPPSQPARAGDRSCAVGPVRALDPGQLGRVAATRRSTRRRSRRSARPARAPPRAGSGG